MTYDSYRLIFMISAILAGLMLIVAAILFFVLKIPGVIGDLTGSTARKAIEDIHTQNAGNQPQAQKSGTKKQESKKASKAADAGKTPENRSGDAARVNTGKLSTERLKREAARACANENETATKDQTAGATTVLSNDAVAAAVSPGQTQETTVLAPETTVLSQDNWSPQPVQAEGGTAAFVIEYELTYVHSDERIV